MGKAAELLRVNGLVRLEVERDLFLFTLVGEDSANEQDKPIGRDTIIEFESLLGARNSGEYGEAVNTGLDVGSRPEFLRQHGRRTRYLILEDE